MISFSVLSGQVRLGWSYKTIQKTTCDLRGVPCVSEALSVQIRFRSSQVTGQHICGLILVCVVHKSCPPLRRIFRSVKLLFGSNGVLTK